MRGGGLWLRLHATSHRHRSGAAMTKRSAWLRGGLAEGRRKLYVKVMCLQDALYKAIKLSVFKQHTKELTFACDSWKSVSLFVSFRAVAVVASSLTKAHKYRDEEFIGYCQWRNKYKFRCVWEGELILKLQKIKIISELMKMIIQGETVRGGGDGDKDITQSKEFMTSVWINYGQLLLACILGSTTLHISCHRAHGLTLTLCPHRAGRGRPFNSLSSPRTSSGCESSRSTQAATATSSPTPLTPPHNAQNHWRHCFLVRDCGTLVYCFLPRTYTQCGWMCLIGSSTSSLLVWPLKVSCCRFPLDLFKGHVNVRKPKSCVSPRQFTDANTICSPLCTIHALCTE